MMKLCCDPNAALEIGTGLFQSWLVDVELSTTCDKFNA